MIGKKKKKEEKGERNVVSVIGIGNLWKKKCFEEENKGRGKNERK